MNLNSVVQCFSVLLVTLLISFQSQATYTGLTSELVLENSIPGYSTYRIYANFDDAADQLISITGYDGGSIFINSSGDFYQNTNGGGLATAINPAFFGLVPELEYDSWLTIGGEDNSLSGLNTVGLDLTNFEAGQNFQINTDPGGGMFVIPGFTPESFPDAQGRVLLAQLTSNGDIDIQLNVQWRDSNGISTDELAETVAQEVAEPAAYTGLSYELVASDAITGSDTYRVYANFSSPTAQLVTVFGQDPEPLELSTTGSFYQNALGGPLSSDINSAALGLDADLAYDSWVTIGTEQAPNDLTPIGADFAAFEAGGTLLIDGIIGGGWFVIPDSEPSAFPDAQGRVLVAQVTTDGITTFSSSIQHRVADGTSYISYDSITFPDQLFGCTDALACNYNSAATDDDGSCTLPTGCETCSGATDGTGTVVDNDADNDGVCDADEIAGCQDSNACNYNAEATDDDGSCTLPTGCETCSGATDGTGTVVDNDADDDGVCDADEIAGCQDSNACNYNAAATDDDGSCTLPTGCETCSGATDGTGTVVDNDADDDGVCDADEIAGCQDANACNYNAAATDDDGSCTLPTGCETCSGATDGTGTVVDNDADNDGVCDADEIVGCQDSNACNYNAAATDAGSCTLPTGCETCSGATDGTGTVVDNDADNDGVCDADEIVGCQDSNACNYNEDATDAGSCDIPTGCETCSGATDGTGTVVDNDADNDGVCDADEIVGCQDSNACNYNVAATDSGSCDIPTGCESCSGATDGTGTIVDNDADNDGVCDDDEVVGCQNEAACNYYSSATDSGPCIFATGACDTCSGATDGTGFVVDNDADNDGVCDADEVLGCTDASACNFSSAATDEDGSCEFNVDECGNCGGTDTSGCTDPTALNFDPNADCDDSSCQYPLAGCTYSFALNYNPLATDDDGSCLERIDGCTDNTALNYDSTANNDDGSCEYPVNGCTDCSADNYDSTATDDDGSCTYPVTCEGDFNDDGLISASDLTTFLAIFGQPCPE